MTRRLLVLTLAAVAAAHASADPAGTPFLEDPPFSEVLTAAKASGKAVFIDFSTDT